MATALDTFRAFVQAGQRLAEIHVHYEQQPEYPLTKVEKKGEKLDYAVKKMKAEQRKNHAHLQPIPDAVWHSERGIRIPPRKPFRPRMGHRPISGLNRQAERFTNDPNRSDDPECILRLIGQVISVSLETVKIVNSLPPIGQQE